MLGLSTLLTSCEDILGTWERPTGAAVTPSEIAVTSITLDKTAIAIVKSTTETLSVTAIAPADATDKSVTWSSDDTSIATVADGVVTGVVPGTTTITATASSGVTATCDVTVYNLVDLSTLPADYEAQDYDMLTGKLSSARKITIADGATIALKDADINGNGSLSKSCAGLAAPGGATIVLEGTNKVKTFDNYYYAGIFVPSGKTLTIKGTGSLEVSGKTGIGANNGSACGNIEILGGTIIATAIDGAGIGGCYNGNCGDITISGGTVTATAEASSNAAGIGSGTSGSCGAITITSTVTKVTATRCDYSGSNIIGAGYGGSCVAVTIDGVADATTSSTFENFTSEVDVSGKIWTLTHK